MKTLRTKIFLIAVSLVALSHLAGCYFPTFWTKDKYTQKDISGFTAEVSIKDDVLKKFGQPSLIWETEHIYVYKWQKLEGIFCIGGYTAGAGDCAAVYKDKALFVLFDQDDCVKRIELAAKKSSESYGDFLMRWHAEKQN